ncbi:MAG: nucleoside monophosphate kinase [Patescibacteria group bacterium]
MDKDSVYHLKIEEEGIPKTFLFVGRSGCGKGTQAKLLIDYLKSKGETPVFYLETGEIFRGLIKNENYTGKLSSQLNSEGKLQPEFLAVWAWSHLMVENLRGDEHLVLDGLPRRLHEAPVLDSALNFYERKMPFFIYINVSRDWSKERLSSRKRSDDTEDSINKRLDWFDTEVVSTIDFFKQNPNYKFLEINGERTIEEIHKELMTMIF